MLELKVISNYLIENHFVDNYEDSLNLIPAMSDSWLEDVLLEYEELLYEMRKEDKVAGKKKTPPFVTSPGKVQKGKRSIERDSNGNLRVVREPNISIPGRKIMNPELLMPVRRQGGRIVEPSGVGDVRVHNDPLVLPGSLHGGFVQSSNQRRHPHGGQSIFHPGVLGHGSQRGKFKKRKRGEPIPQPSSIVSTFQSRRESNRTASAPFPTRLDILRAMRAARNKDN